MDNYFYLKNLDLTSEQGFNRENANSTGNLKNFLRPEKFEKKIEKEFNNFDFFNVKKSILCFQKYTINLILVLIQR